MISLSYSQILKTTNGIFESDLSEHVSEMRRIYTLENAFLVLKKRSKPTGLNSEEGLNFEWS